MENSAGRLVFSCWAVATALLANHFIQDPQNGLSASDTGALKKKLLKRYAVVWCIYRGLLGPTVEI